MTTGLGGGDDAAAAGGAAADDAADVDDEAQPAVPRRKCEMTA